MAVFCVQNIHNNREQTNDILPQIIVGWCTLSINAQRVKYKPRTT